jgi:hypothetical protein
MVAGKFMPCQCGSQNIEIAFSACAGIVYCIDCGHCLEIDQHIISLTPENQSNLIYTEAHSALRNNLITLWNNRDFLPASAINHRGKQ